MSALVAFTMLLCIFCAVVYTVLLRKLDKANQMYEDAKESLRKSNANLDLISYRNEESARLREILRQRLNQIEASIHSQN